MSNLKLKPETPHFNDFEVTEQLKRICKSDEFLRKKLLCKFLSYIVEQTLSGNENILKGYTIAIEVFEKGDEFDSQLDSLVRIHAGRLRRTLKSYYEEAGKNDLLIIQIPKGAYIPVFKKNEKVALEKDYLSEGLVSKSTEFLKPSIAILPFKNLTENPADDYISFGFVEELSVELTNYEDLIVYDCVPWSNSLYIQTDFNEFIKNKNIRFAIDGSIYKVGDQLTILVKLTDNYRKNQIWAHRYKNEITSINFVEILESITQNIASVVGSEFGIILQNLNEENKRRKQNSNTTFEAVLKFYHYVAVVSPDTGEQAFIALSEALKNNSSGIAMACLGVMHSDSYVFDEPISDESYEIFGNLAEKAILLEPNSYLVNTILTVKHFIYNERERFNTQFDKCFKMGPDWSLNSGTLAFHFMCFGDWERGKEIMDNVIKNNFKYPCYFHAATFLYHYRLKEYENAEIEASKIILLDLFWTPMLKLAVLGQLKRKDKIDEQISELKRLKPDFEKKASYLISRFVKEIELVDHVIEGIRKAGLKI